MYFIKMIGNKLDPMDKGRALFDPYALHQMMYDVLAESSGRDFLYRAAKSTWEPTVYVVSPRVPKNTGGWSCEVRGPLKTEYAEGDKLVFSLIANLTTTRNGHRFGVVEDTIHQGLRPGKDATEEAPVRWLSLRADRLGMQLDTCSVVNVSKEVIERPAGRVHLEIVEMTGSLTVVDPDRFRTLLCKGVGRARGFGYGMMMVRAPVT